jgi:hypothetical protein
MRLFLSASLAAKISAILFGASLLLGTDETRGVLVLTRLSFLPADICSRRLNLIVPLAGFIDVAGPDLIGWAAVTTSAMLVIGGRGGPGGGPGGAPLAGGRDGGKIMIGK